MPQLRRLFYIVPTTVICSQIYKGAGHSWCGLADAILDKLWGLPVVQTLPAYLEREFHTSGSEIAGLLGMAPLICSVGVFGLLDRGGRVVNLQGGAAVVILVMGCPATDGLSW